MSADMEFEGGPESPGNPWDMTSDPNQTMTASPPVDRHEVELRHRFCVIDCRHPWPGEAAFKCPSCGGKVVIEAKTGPEPSRFGVWIGGWLRAWRDALDVLRVRDPGPQVELPCPVCEAAEWREMAQALISECGEHTVSEAKECQECDP